MGLAKQVWILQLAVEVVLQSVLHATLQVASQTALQVVSQGARQVFLAVVSAVIVVLRIIL